MRSEAKKFLHLAAAFSYHLSGMASLLNRVRDSEEVTASYSPVIQVTLDVRDRVAKAVAVSQGTALASELAREISEQARLSA